MRLNYLKHDLMHCPQAVIKDHQESLRLKPVPIIRREEDAVGSREKYCTLVVFVVSFALQMWNIRSLLCDLETLFPDLVCLGPSIRLLHAHMKCSVSNPSKLSNGLY